jgi:hypothetical protein
VLDPKEKYLQGYEDKKRNKVFIRTQLAAYLKLMLSSSSHGHGLMKYSTEADAKNWFRAWIRPWSQVLTTAREAEFAEAATLSVLMGEEANEVDTSRYNDDDGAAVEQLDFTDGMSIDE